MGARRGAQPHRSLKTFHYAVVALSQRLGYLVVGVALRLV